MIAGDPIDICTNPYKTIAITVLTSPAVLYFGATPSSSAKLSRIYGKKGNIVGVPETVILDANGHELPAGIGQLLAIIARNKTISRAHLEQQSRLSRATIVQRLGVLFNAGLITEADETAPSGGRPSKLLKINETFALTLAADIGESMIRVVLTTLEPRIVAEITFANSFDIAPETTLRELMAQGEKLLAGIGRKKADLLGIGLSLPAPVDYDNALVVGPSVMRGWDGFDIRGWFREQHAIRVFADNDVNLMAVAEQRAHWPDEDSFFFIKAGTGIGSGIVTRGELFRGGQGAAGDVGHIQLDWAEPPLCRCGKLGCLEAYAAGWAIARTLRDKGFEAESARDIINLVQRNVPEAIQQIRFAGRGLGEIVASVVSILNPSRIVVGGTLALAGEHLLAGIREQVSQRCLPLATRKLQISTARSDERAGVLGAAQLVIDERLQSIGK